MIRQEGFLLLHGGSLGRTTFAKRNGIYTAQQRRTNSKLKREQGGEYQNVRESQSEFGTASTAGKLLRKAISKLLDDAKDKGINGRLQKQMRNVLKLDTTSLPGKRNVTAGDKSLLPGFNFNNNARLRAAFNVKFQTQLNRDSGELIINIPSFKPIPAIKAPVGTTHYKVVSAGAVVNFEEITYASEIFQSPLLPWDGIGTLPISAIHHVPANSIGTLFLVLGIQFFQVSGQWINMVKLGNANPLCVVAVG